jgi:hypothetical protein
MYRKMTKEQLWQALQSQTDGVGPRISFRIVHTDQDELGKWFDHNTWAEMRATWTEKPTNTENMMTIALLTHLTNTTGIVILMVLLASTRTITNHVKVRSLAVRHVKTPIITLLTLAVIALNKTTTGLKEHSQQNGTALGRNKSPGMRGNPTWKRTSEDNHRDQRT